MKEWDRDESIERLLRAMPPAGAPERRGCLDPETLAAWADGALNRSALASVEGHAASCARCQSLLAAMAKTAPAADAGGVQGKAVRPWIVRAAPWLAPFGAAAMAAALAIALIPRAEPPQPASLQVTEAAAEKQAVPERSAAADAPASAASPRLAEVQTRVRQEEKDRETAAPRPQTDEFSDRRAAPADVKSEIPPSAVQEKTTAPPSSVVPPPAAPPVPVPKASTPPPQATAPVELRRDTNLGMAGSSTAARRKAAQEFAFEAASLTISSPDPEIHWQVRNGTGVLIRRTADGGATWGTPTSVTDRRVIAGFAVSTEVCWIAGDQGFIMVTTDGDTWERVPFPEPVALKSITATSADAATVTTADGRLFSTSDRGRSWGRK